MKDWHTPQFKKLAQAFLSLRSSADMEHFLRDLCTLEELGEMSRRWQAVQMLHDGIPYRKIALETGLSTATVTRIAHWLNNGEGGYQAALKKSSKKSK
jgi:TrpR-related protein YerC/YecD